MRIAPENIDAPFAPLLSTIVFARERNFFALIPRAANSSSFAKSTDGGNFFRSASSPFLLPLTIGGLSMENAMGMPDFFACCISFAHVFPSAWRERAVMDVRKRHFELFRAALSILEYFSEFPRLTAKVRCLSGVISARILPLAPLSA